MNIDLPDDTMSGSNQIQTMWRDPTVLLDDDALHAD